MLEKLKTLLRKCIALICEASFGAWAGWRGYNIVSSQHEDSYNEIAKIPLCAGKSLISEKVCDEWVELVHKEIPRTFWNNLDVLEQKERRLKDDRRWRAVRDFADNCAKRKAYEDIYRRQNGMSPGSPVHIPNEVPNDILLSLYKKKSN